MAAAGEAATKFRQSTHTGRRRGPLRQSLESAPHHDVVAKVHTDLGSSDFRSAFLGGLSQKLERFS